MPFERWAHVSGVVSADRSLARSNADLWEVMLGVGDGLSKLFA